MERIDIIPLIKIDAGLNPNEKAKRWVKAVVCHVAPTRSAQGVNHNLVFIKDESATRLVRSFMADELVVGKSYTFKVTILRNKHDSAIFLDTVMEIDPLPLSPQITGLSEIMVDDYSQVVIRDRLVLKKMYPDEDKKITKALFARDELKPVYVTLWEEDLEALPFNLEDRQGEEFVLDYFLATTKPEHKAISVKPIRGVSVLKPAI